LEHVEQEFTKLFKPNRIQRCNAYGLDKIFKPNMRSAMHYYNVNHGTLVRDERVQKVMAKVQDMRDVMSRNVNLLLERGDTVDSLLAKSDMLNEDAKVFKKKSGVMLRQQRRKYWLRKAVLAVIILLLITWATIGVCGVGLHYCRIRENRGGEGGNGDGGGNGDDGGN
jgi:vesicle-associated membrane protein 7